MSRQLAEIVRDYGTERPIPCDAERWSASLADYGFAEVVPTQLFDAIVQNGNQITRDMVFEYQDGRPSDLLVAAMLWGFGPLAYGPYRTAQMLTENTTGVTVADVVDEIRAAATESPSAGFSALFSSGRPRLQQLGIAMGTKLLYFSGGRRGGSQTPLILDKVVHTACGQVGLEAPNPRRYTTANSYADYCAETAARAKALRITPDALEMSLFNWQQRSSTAAGGQSPAGRRGG